FALVGGIWFIFLLGHAVSVATAVGFIALAGLAAEFGVVMLVYLDSAIRQRIDHGQFATDRDLDEALIEGAALRVRPLAMTVFVILAGLFPLLIGGGAGHEVMQRLAAPMVGGMITAPLLSLFVLPAIYKLIGRRRLAAPQAQHDPLGSVGMAPAAHDNDRSELLVGSTGSQSAPSTKMT
ncbi:MAG: hypothetical protein HOP95_12835, partial [Sphingomonas sp.]|nr:hypothetical protein [Sphingomonas sp.]